MTNIPARLWCGLWTWPWRSCMDLLNLKKRAKNSQKSLRWTQSSSCGWGQVTPSRMRRMWIWTLMEKGSFVCPTVSLTQSERPERSRLFFKSYNKTAVHTQAKPNGKKSLHNNSFLAFCRPFCGLFRCLSSTSNSR